MRVAPRETTKLLGEYPAFGGGKAILPAATAELHHNGHVPYPGDKVAGTDRSLSRTESGLLATHTITLS
jgi:hypothetical protein